MTILSKISDLPTTLSRWWRIRGLRAEIRMHEIDIKYEQYRMEEAQILWMRDNRRFDILYPCEDPLLPLRRAKIASIEKLRDEAQRELWDLERLSVA